jgi:hypothetical protein
MAFYSSEGAAFFSFVFVRPDNFLVDVNKDDGLKDFCPIF